MTARAPSAGDLLAAMELMSNAERVELDGLLKNVKRNAGSPDLVPSNFPAQKRWMLDDAPFKASFCSRRAAKSFSVGLEFINDSFTHPGAHYLFVMTVRSQAKRDFWENVLKPIDREHDLGIKFNESELIALMPNRARIYVGAADSTDSEWRKMIGGKYRKVHIDEAQAFIHADLGALVYEAFKPAVADWRGSIGMSGTPGAINKGLFFDVTQGREAGWSLHRWSTVDNPYMREKILAEMDELKKLKPGIEKTPAYRRNYLAEWVIEDDSLVYRYMAGRNEFNGKLPNVAGVGRWHYILAFDLGYNDPTAFCLMTYHDSHKVLYILDTYKRSGMDITSVSNQAKTYLAGRTLDAMVVDGSNKQAVMEMSNRHGLSLLQSADKTGKADFIELLNADLITERIRIGPGAQDLKDELASLVWNDKSAKREEHPACENHACDAMLYGWRFCYQYMSKEKEKELVSGSQEWAKDMEIKMFKRLSAEIERDKMMAAEPWEHFGEEISDWGVE